MYRFEVWAPSAETVEVQLDGKRSPLEREERGYWGVDLNDAQPGDDYGYVIDGSDPVLPDPRSSYQPFGVHGLSRLVDHSAFSWTDDGWQPPPLETGIVYELHVGTFTPDGTFDALIEKLDYLKGLGITHVELMPVCEFPGSRGWGYDGVDLFAPHHAYGGPDGLKRFVNACHEKGLAALLDVVYNHLGPSGNYLARFGPYFNANYHTPWGAAVNLDGPGSTEVRRFLCDNATLWMRDYHFDGLRLDAVHAFLDRSAVHFLEQLATETEQLSREVGRRLVLVAESDLNQPLIVTPRCDNGYGIDAQWSDDFHHAIHTVLTGERSGYYSDFGDLSQVAKALASGYVYDGIYSRSRGRNHGRPAQHLPSTRFLGYSQNHDQIGNRAQGERLSHLLSVGQSKIAAALVLLSPFVPMLFQGEEFAASSPFQFFTDHDDPEVGRATTEGRRHEFISFGWNPAAVPDPQAKSTYDRSRLNWQETGGEPHHSILRWYRQLIELRRSHDEFTPGDFETVTVSYDDTGNSIALTRGSFTLVCNLGLSRLDSEAPEGAEIILRSEEEVRLDGGRLMAPGHSAVVFRH